jgi:hypothetical protein
MAAVPNLFIDWAKFLTKKALRAKKRHVKHHEGPKSVWFIPILSHKSLVIQ